MFCYVFLYSMTKYEVCLVQHGAGFDPSIAEVCSVFVFEVFIGS
jgi:hypothetical protein